MIWLVLVLIAILAFFWLLGLLVALRNERVDGEIMKTKAQAYQQLSFLKRKRGKLVKVGSETIHSLRDCTRSAIEILHMLRIEAKDPEVQERLSRSIRLIEEAKEEYLEALELPKKYRLGQEWQEYVPREAVLEPRGQAGK